MPNKNEPTYPNYVIASTYNKYEKCTLIKKWKVMSGPHLGQIASITVKKDKTGKKIYSLRFKEANA